ncbi:MAG: HIT family protein [Thermoplasmata archaeon]
MGEPAAKAPCVFCEIVARRIPAYIIYEDAATLAFLDLFPFTRGHLLVIPKRHGERLTDLPFDDQIALIRTLDELCRRSERLTPDYNVSLNAGASAGQVVFHAHFHVIPRYGESNPFHPRTRVRLPEDDAQALLRELSTP